MKYLIYLAAILLGLSSCNKEEEEYVSKNVKVESVFDQEEKSTEGPDQPKEDSNKEEEKEDQDKAKEEDKDKEENQENQENQEDDNKANTPATGKKYVTIDGINLRSEPNTQADNIIEVIDKGTEVQAIEEMSANGIDWVKINFEGKEGYISRAVVEEVRN